ncbi:MAG: isoprenylcysteine carboxylmethyltransferase family protein [Anaerolineales bacterium]|nr:isoprenylcysteine carboxylmethyltransferase family protein [Anaerolineales bacterium]
MIRQFSLKRILIDGTLMNVLISIVVYGFIYLNPLIWVSDYPPDIQAAVGPVSAPIGQQLAMGVLFLLILAGVPLWSSARLRRENRGELSFPSAFVHNALLALFFASWDLLILDWLIFVTIQPAFIVIPGTEGLAGYQDYWFHLQVSFLGWTQWIAILAAGLILGGLAMIRPGGQPMSEKNRGTAGYFAQLVFFLGVWAACLFVSAGRLDWGAGWVFLALSAAGQIVTAVILRIRYPGLMGERASLEGKWDLDRILAGVLALWGPAAICIVGGLDQRHGWPPEIPLAWQLAGVAIAAAGAALTAWAMAANRFFYGVMRIAKERGHAVCDSGPYRFVRHPGYLGAIGFDLAAALVLQSVWALIPAAVTVLAIVIRTAREDKALQAGLDGYREYAQRVRSRLLPLVW